MPLNETLNNTGGGEWIFPELGLAFRRYKRVGLDEDLPWLRNININVRDESGLETPNSLISFSTQDP
jgi:hypothetical protein